MFGSGWCGGMSAGGWLLMALIWGSFLAAVPGPLSRAPLAAGRARAACWTGASRPVKSMKKATYGCVAT